MAIVQRIVFPLWRRWICE